VRDVVTSAVRCTFGAEPSQMSFLFFLTIVKSAGGVNDLFEASDGAAQEFVLDQGAGSIIENVANEIKTDVNIALDQPVTTIDQSDEDSVFISTAGGRIFKCNRVIVCIPPPQQSKITWMPKLSTRKLFSINSSQMCLLIKVVVHFEECHWKMLGYSGEVVSCNNDGPVCICFDDSDENNPALVAFIGGKLAIHWADRTEGDMRNSVISHLADCLGSWVYQYTDVTIKNWAKEQFIEGSPVTVPKCGTMEWWPALRETHQRVHFGGTETATSWIGYMDGAVQSGVRAALEVLDILKPQTLSSEDFKELQKYSSDHLTAPTTQFRVYKRFGVMLILSAAGLALVTYWRRNWAHCFIPFR